MNNKKKIKAEIERMMSEEKAFFEDNCKHGNAESSSSAVVYTRLQMLLKRIDSLPEEPVSEDLEEAASDYVFKKHKSPLSMIMHQADLKAETQYINDCESCFIAGANWQKKNLWKDAQGDDLPEIDREVIVLQGRKVVFAHRPNPEGWDGKSLSTGEVEHYTPMIYGKGGWNMEGVTYWLDVELPKGIE